MENIPMSGFDTMVAEALAKIIIPILLTGAFGILPQLLLLGENFDQGEDFLNFPTDILTGATVYDFIVVGSGSSGGVVATRLSEKFNVLLLERGGEPSPLQVIPGLSTVLLNYPETDYMYKTVPQKVSCLSLNQQQSSWSRGRGLGGCSNLNLMVHLRGHPQDYNNWAEVTRDNRWSYEGVTPFFKKSEDYCYDCEYDPNDVVNRAYHSQGGLLPVAKSSYRPLVQEFLEAAEWNGIPRADLNAPYVEGASAVTYNARFGRRWSIYKGFLEPIRLRPSLTIVKHARVYKVLLSATNEAYGVEYERWGRRRVAMASKEIILSAGAVDSAHILLLSGIGPKNDLEAVGVEVKVDSPVGQNLQDHIGVFLGPFLVDLSGASFIVERDVQGDDVALFLVNGTGSLTQTGIHANAFFVSDRAKSEGQSTWPDTQFMLLGIGNSGVLARDFCHAFNVRNDILTQYYAPTQGHDAYQIVVMLSRPKQRGQLWLKSSDYRDSLNIDPKYFEDNTNGDLQVMIDGVKRAVFMAENAPSFKKINSRLLSNPFPSCAHQPFRSDPYWECLIRHFSVSIFHFTGTITMGVRGSKEAVVDSELRVIGTSRLRVIDASIMPTVVTVNTNAAAVMIAERGAQFVLDTWIPAQAPPTVYHVEYP